MGYGYVTLIERMLCEPFAERHGRWINGKCSVCEADAPYTYDGFWEETPYCFNCGSRMDLEDDEDK